MDNIFVKTKHCIIRYLTYEDYHAYINGYKNCMPSKNRFDDSIIDIATLTSEWYHQLLDRFREECEKDICYNLNVFENGTGNSVGYCNIRKIIREDIQCGEIGYTIFNNYWNRGYGTEVVGALTEIGFSILKFHRLEAYINLDNSASKAVVKKCGYLFEGIRKDYILEDGAWTDNEVYYRINKIGN